MTAYGHSAGESIECLSIAIQLRKEETVDSEGNIAYRVGFKIGGGIDQDPACAPFKYPDQGIYITHIDEDSPAARAGLRRHDKILSVNGLDFTLLTHERAVKYIKKYAVLDILVARAELPPLH
ncbi:PDZ/DHR/GLGF domain protein [Dictyocaulus viviparus]|uniref:PDZ/DHR/GLGF domain protein n=1 Tax=Dictyocaulus viviparus TaxID=29172 RepID=A0A0D8XLW1_DICVI|nr:PDZ/DHR/GLGF domain protein [Dictyocaulus viviparus]